ncbi:hypothetical protein HanRHA438_Chr01g0030141 [Helianthus annuus]|nr:hypothetical protein HanRHA438_Chr01g0030141 [Helianthus annuus]
MNKYCIYLKYKTYFALLNVILACNVQWRTQKLFSWRTEIFKGDVVCCYIVIFGPIWVG